MARSKAIIHILLFQRGDRLWTLESDVYTRQFLTSKVDPRAERVKYVLPFALTISFANN